MAGSASASQTFHRSKGVVGCKVVLVTDASGDTTASVVGEFYGRLVGFMYDGGLDASAVITLKDFATGATLFAYTTGTEGTPIYVRPTTNIVTNAGAAVTAADTAVDVNRDIKVAGKVTVTVASGGNAETGTIKLVIDEKGLGLDKGK